MSIVQQPTVQPKASGVNLANVGFALAGEIAGAFITSSYAKADAKKQRQLEEQLAKLDLAQQKELTERMQNVQGEVAKQAEYYKFIAEQNKNEMINRIQGKRYTSYIVLGVGVMLLALVVLKLAKK
jgi:uncharacterized membrane protein